MTALHCTWPDYHWSRAYQDYHFFQIENKLHKKNAQSGMRHHRVSLDLFFSQFLSFLIVFFSSTRKNSAYYLNFGKKRKKMAQSTWHYVTMRSLKTHYHQMIIQMKAIYVCVKPSMLSHFFCLRSDQQQKMKTKNRDTL